MWCFKSKCLVPRFFFLLFKANIMQTRSKLYPKTCVRILVVSAWERKTEFISVSLTFNAWDFRALYYKHSVITVFKLKNLTCLPFWSGCPLTKKLIFLRNRFVLRKFPKDSLSDAIMFAVALSSAPNHKAASLVGELRRNGWARAARVWPPITAMNLVSWGTKSNPLSILTAAPTAFNQAPKRI